MRTRLALALLGLCLASAAAANTVTFKGFSNASLGGATLTVFGTDSLVVSNIGSSGNDGVSISAATLTVGNELEIKSPTILRNIATGSFMESKAIGTLNGVGGSLLLTQRATRNAAGTVHETIDLSPIGAPATAVTAYKNGVAQQHSDFAGSSFSGDMAIGTVTSASVYDWSIIFPPLQFDDTWNGSSASATDGNAAMSLSGPADFQFLFAPKATNTVSAVSASEVRGGGGLTSITIVDEALIATPSAVPAMNGWMALVGALLLLVLGVVVLRKGRGNASSMA